MNKQRMKQHAAIAVTLKADPRAVHRLEGRCGEGEEIAGSSKRSDDPRAAKHEFRGDRRVSAEPARLAELGERARFDPILPPDPNCRQLPAVDQRVDSEARDVQRPRHF